MPFPIEPSPSLTARVSAVFIETELRVGAPVHHTLMTRRCMAALAGRSFCRSGASGRADPREDMSMASCLRFGALGPSAVHLCVDMETLCAERTDWHEARRERTVFTRFVPPARPEDATGAWRRYYAHWRHMTGERLDPRLIQLVPPLAASFRRRRSSTRRIIRHSRNRLFSGCSSGLEPMR
jgi:hypothetical protein